MTLRMLIDRVLDADLFGIISRLSDAATLWAAGVIAVLLLVGLAVAGWSLWSNRRQRRRPGSNGKANP